jgi:hypothetical protein
MKLFRGLIAGLALAAGVSGPSHAQRQPLYQSGTSLAANEILKGITSGTATGVGGLSGDANGHGANPFSITDNNGCGLRFNNALTTGSHNWFCFGHNAQGSPVTIINGTEFAIPGQFGGNLDPGKVLANNQGTPRLASPVAGVIIDASNSFYKAGNNLFPVYAEPAATTATSTTGSSTITVTSGTGINQYDQVNAPFVPFGAYVVSLVGTTVTMSTDATATNVSPVPVTFGQSRFSKENSILTNTLAAQIGNFGSASRGHSTYMAQHFPALDLSWASIYSISPIGQTAIATATQSSDNSLGGFTITDICFVSANHQTVAQLTWCQYLQSHLPASAAQGSHLQIESSLDNHWTISGDMDPYNVNPAIRATNLRLDNGLDFTLGQLAKPATAALDIVNNGGTYRSGIVFDNNAFDYSDARAFAPAIAMGSKQGSCWYTAAGGSPSWCIWASASDPVSTFHMRDNSGSADFLSVNAATGNLALGEPTKLTVMENPLILKEYTVATLPACNAQSRNAIVAVSDATAPTYNGALTGGGTVRVPAFCDGAAWTSH